MKGIVMNLHRTPRPLAALLIFVLCGPALPFCAAQTHSGNAFSGEAKLEILQRYTGPHTLPRPGQVVVENFANDGPIVATRSLLLGRSQPLREPPDQLIQQLQISFSKTLLGQFKKLSIPAAGAQDAGPSLGPIIVVQGEFISIAPGNSRQRVIVGFGRGASGLKMHLVVSEIVNGETTVLIECNIHAQSGKQPGAILSTSGTGFAVGVATGHFGDKLTSTVQADASRMAKLVGKQIKAIAVEQQWNAG
jgi:hypothetical protein